MFIRTTLWGEEVIIMSRTCSKCGVELTVDNFSNHSGSDTLLRAECKACTNKLRKVREDLEKIYPRPGKDYICPICNGTHDEVKDYGGKAGAWVLDHDHKTEQFRCYLCHKCNRGLGAFGDNVDFLKNAVEYLINSQNGKILEYYYGFVPKRTTLPFTDES